MIEILIIIIVGAMVGKRERGWRRGHNNWLQSPSKFRREHCFITVKALVTEADITVVAISVGKTPTYPSKPCSDANLLYEASYEL